ncbi:hypothetical protein AB205_0103360 [Aquarana catesbeiana]|uniref:Uncharacterized protein n=1 Tax=Aquarana catesbeiana TaxID=8400 RepID=A0A2G9S0L1_AQUCT|nr:hypothetical protein AB205_0103360 [Aquarana catesbeiana]
MCESFSEDSKDHVYLHLVAIMPYIPTAHNKRTLILKRKKLKEQSFLPSSQETNIQANSLDKKLFFFYFHK